MKKTDLFKPKPVVPVTAWRHQGYLCSSEADSLLEALRDEIADVIFLDPPFNLGKDYGPAGNIERMAGSSYYVYMKSIIRQCTRILAPGGSLFLYHVPYWATRFAATLHEELEFRHWIALSMKNGFARGQKLYPAHYALLYYTKGAPHSFTRPRIRPQSCPHCGELVKDYGGYRSIIEKKGINLTDVWEDISPIRHRSRKLRSANQLPLAITDRVISIAGVAGGLLVDPFMGTGTCLVSALSGNMQFVGNDLDPSMKELVAKRLSEAAI